LFNEIILTVFATPNAVREELRFLATSASPADLPRVFLEMSPL
jgi:hypothetical protein